MLARDVHSLNWKNTSRGESASRLLVIKVESCHVNAIYSDENVWLSQKMIGLLYGVESHTINYHLQKA